MKRILLLGAGGNAGINFTKCMHMAGYKVYGADMNKYYLDSCNADVKVNIDFSDKLNSILKIVDYHKIDVIHAQPDPEVKWLLDNREQFEDKIFDHNIHKWLFFRDKLLCQDIWGKTMGSFETHSFVECCLNPVLFERMKVAGNGKVWVRAISGAGSKAALPVTTFQQALNWVEYWEETKRMNPSEFMLAEFLPGREFAVQTFWYKGELIHSQARERLIYFFGALMPSGQTSTPAVAKTISEQRVYDAAQMAILDIDNEPHGIYCVDMKENSRGDIIPMEVNYGRFFTTSDFFATMGVNTPAEHIASMFPDYKPERMINYLNPDYYWIRGLDKEPKLIKYE